MINFTKTLKTLKGNVLGLANEAIEMNKMAYQLQTEMLFIVDQELSALASKAAGKRMQVVDVNHGPCVLVTKTGGILIPKSARAMFTIPELKAIMYHEAYHYKTGLFQDELGADAYAASNGYRTEMYSVLCKFSLAKQGYDLLTNKLAVRLKALQV